MKKEGWDIGVIENFDQDPGEPRSWSFARGPFHPDDEIAALKEVAKIKVYEEAVGLLLELTRCINSATAEDHADSVLKPCCHATLLAAKDWLTLHDPSWWERGFSSLDDPTERAVVDAE